jgi:serine/threonine protein kinase
VKLFRCYDNRLRPTERRPDLYEKNSELFGKSDIILVLKDINGNNTPLLQFGETLPEDTSAMDWLFAYRGQLKIISTPFHTGVHYATHPEHFIPIIDHLEALHINFYVHGDIRAYNMVLNYENPKNLFGKLIDFDYGGEVTKKENEYLYPKYPRGYVQSLHDGVRVGRPGENITYDHDWRALGSVILELYTLVPGFITKEANQANLRNNRKYQLDCIRMAFLKWDSKRYIDLMKEAFLELDEECTILPSENPGPFLRDYLVLAQKYGFELERTNMFQLDLENCNMIQSGTPRIDSKGATGSPKTR